MTKGRFRCAIYTRKSTEEGLDQDFDSLDAQREACEAYVASQASLGWKAIKAHYDDPGISGGHMDRPALQRLLADIEAGKIDVVVVYKIDRLTRSLMDFAKMVAVFDRQDVSFVSVTQQFNTTTSMGRLTLNVLLSFAQFEREVTAERIRDKIAASKKKGMWMGGVPPLGYDVENKRLIVNDAEAEIVRNLFTLYLEIGNVRSLKVRTDGLGLRTKRHVCKSGRVVGGKPFSRGHLYALLSNSTYIGEVCHRGARHPGQHVAIVDERLWRDVQDHLAANTVRRKLKDNVREQSLLAGLVFDEKGDRLSPSHATKHGKRYRYYISHRLMQTHTDGKDGWRLPATELEASVIRCLTELLCDPKRAVDLVTDGSASPSMIHSIRTRAREMTGDLVEGHPTEKSERLRNLVVRIGVSPGRLTIEVDRAAIVDFLGYDLAESRDGDEVTEPLVIEKPFAIKRRGVEARIVLGYSETDSPSPDDKLVNAIATAHRWFELLTSGQLDSVQDIALAEERSRSDVSLTLPLAFLAPDIVDAIVTGKQPVDLTWERLKRTLPLPSCWCKQRRLLGFEPASLVGVNHHESPKCSRRNRPTETDAQTELVWRQTSVSR